jgi:tetratricopeptide (TPR) repeat protein
VARQSKKHAREVRRDRVREKALEKFEVVGDRLEGRGREILYGLGVLVLAAGLGYAFWVWRERKADEAQQAMGRAIEIASAEVGASPAPSPGSTAPTFSSERERAERAAEEFKRVADKYGDPYRSQARYMRATHLLSFDRAQGASELESLARGGDGEVAAWAKFALAQAHESDGQYDEAAAAYRELAAARDPKVIPADTANLRLASVLEKQGKKQEAAELLFQIVKAAREARDKDGKPVAPSASARAAEDQLKKLDPARHAQLPPEEKLDNLPS